MLSKEDFDKFCYKVTPRTNQIYYDMCQYLPTADIISRKRLAMFIAQTAHETGGYRWLSELGGRNYFAKYNNRADLGNNRIGDGFRFKGRGLIQLTGRANYTKFQEFLNKNYPSLHAQILNMPSAVAESPLNVLAAVYYWDIRRLNQWADHGDITTVTRKINGGLNGIEDREKYYQMALDVL